MINGIYDYFFGADEAQSTANKDEGASKNGDQVANNEWIFIEHLSGRSSPVLVASPDLQEIRDEDMDSTLGEKQDSTGWKSVPDRRRLRKIRKEISNQEKKHQIRELVQRRQAIEQKLFENPDASGVESSPAPSASASPVLSATTSPPPKHTDNVKPTLQRKKKRASRIFQPKQQ